MATRRMSDVPSWVKWVLGIVSTLFVIAASGVTAKTYSNAERVVAVETDMTNVKKQLDKMDSKLDRVLEAVE